MGHPLYILHDFNKANVISTITLRTLERVLIILTEV